MFKFLKSPQSKLATGALVSPAPGSNVKGMRFNFGGLGLQSLEEEGQEHEDGDGDGDSDGNICATNQSFNGNSTIKVHDFTNEKGKKVQLVEEFLQIDSRGFKGFNSTGPVGGLMGRSKRPGTTKATGN